MPIRNDLDTTMESGRVTVPAPYQDITGVPIMKRGNSILRSVDNLIIIPKPMHVRQIRRRIDDLVRRIRMLAEQPDSQ